MVMSHLLAAKKLSLFCQPEKISNFLLTDVNVACTHGEDLTHCLPTQYECFSPQLYGNSLYFSKP